jgi:hypothetical protein
MNEICTAMPSSGSWLNVVPDNTTRNEFKSMHFEVLLERRKARASNMSHPLPGTGISHRASRRLGLRSRLFVQWGEMRSTTMATIWPMGASTIAAITR